MVFVAIHFTPHNFSILYAWVQSSSLDYVNKWAMIEHNHLLCTTYYVGILCVSKIIFSSLCQHIHMYSMNSDWAQTSPIYYVSIMYYAWSQTSAHSLCRHTVKYYTVHEHKHLHICRLCPHIQFLPYYVCAYCMYFTLSTRTFPWDQISDWIAHSIRWNTETVWWGDNNSLMLINRFYSS